MLPGKFPLNWGQSQYLFPTIHPYLLRLYSSMQLKFIDFRISYFTQWFVISVLMESLRTEAICSIVFCMLKTLTSTSSTENPLCASNQYIDDSANAYKHLLQQFLLQPFALNLLMHLSNLHQLDNTPKWSY